MSDSERSQGENKRSGEYASSVVLPHIQKLRAYKPPLEGRDPKSMLLLDFNEKVEEMPASIVNALCDYIQDGRLQTYPSYSDTTERLADYVGCSRDEVLLTNGSDQGIELVFRACCEAEDEVIIPGPSFAMYSQCAQVQNLRVHAPQYKKESGFPLQEVRSLIGPSTRLIVISNPNNPCGTSLAVEQIVDLAELAPKAAILVDECYFEYSGRTVTPYINDHRNLFVTRTFSKTWGMPSLRFGYLISAKQNIEALTCVRGPYDVNQLAVVAARAALANRGDVDAYVREVMEVSKPLVESFLQSKGIDFWESSANYLWVFFADPETVCQKLQSRGILVRPKQNADGRVGLRITLGNRAHSEKLLKVLGGIL